MEKRYTISVHDINGKALGVLYDSGSHQSGSAYNIKITKEVSGWKEMSFVLPMRDDDGHENWLAQFIRNENKIYVKAEGEEEDVYLIKEPVGLHDSNKISVTVNASHISEELKTKNLYKYFDDENGISKCSDLIEKAIGGTGWTLGECDTFYEADGTTEKIRSYSCDSKTGAYNMISGICELFYARPIFHGNRVVDIVSQKSTDGWLEANFGMNLTKIQKTYDSSNLVTRLYVEGEYGDFGYVGIDDVNPTGLPFILNFDYYKGLGVFTDAHQAALDAFIRDYKAYSDQISSKTTEILKDQSALNNLISSFGYAYYPVVNGAVSAANRILGSDITDENAELKTGDSVAVVKTDYSYEYKEYPVASLTGVRAIIKFHPTITGTMGANEDMLEASVANVDTFLDEINDVLAEEGKPKTTVAGLKSTYGVTNLETIKSGSFDLSGIPSPYNEGPILEYSYQIGKLETEQSTIRTRLKEYMKTVCESIVNIDSLKKQIAQAVENQAVAENTFATVMGSMLRDGYWSDDNYAPGQEQSLYADALEISKKLAFPIVSYSATIEDLSHAPLCKIEYGEDGKPEYVVDSTYHKELSFRLAQVVRIYDEDMPYNDYAVTTKVVECVDNPTSNSCELQSDLSDIGQKTFASILERVTEMAEKVRQNKDIYERAVAISKDGKIDTSTLEGAIDVLKTKLTSTVSNWKTDANGNIIFESLDGSSAMMLTGNGFMCAASKKEDGSWNWRTFGTGEGFTADMIVTGFLDADRIKANSITVKKLASDVGSGLDISSNESITSIVGDVTEANSKITQTKDKIEWLVSGDGTSQQFALTENGLKAIADDIDLSANNSITSYVGGKIGEVNETINQQASDFAGVVTGINKDIEGLQDQVDGSITTWFYPTAPTDTNKPAQNWTTIDEKNIHLGDLYYDTVTGYCYRWQVKDNAYSWQKITDTDVTKALEDAAGAQNTANEKRRVFVVKPIPPYDVGDLWVQGSDGDIMRCKTAKIAGQSYADADWVKCSKYTDDTQANEAMTQITQTKESVAALATRTTNAEGRITNAEASLELKADSATLSVTETNLKQYVTDAVDNISVGGRNLYTGTRNVDGDDWISKSIWTEDGSYNGCLVFKKSTRWGGLKQKIALEANTQYTLSAWLKQTDGGDVRYYDSVGDTYSPQSGSAVTVGTDWSRCHFTVTISTAGTYAPRFEQDSAGHSLWVAGLKLEKGNKSTDWSPAPEDVNAALNQQAAEFANIVTRIDGDLSSLQSQVDGSITTWFYEVAPTLENVPAKDWTTEDDKNVHLGDLYYDTVTGYCYRWQVQNKVYGWQRITDTDVTKALADAKNAQDTADGKRRVFVVEPTPPYDVGDVWMQGADGDILRCQTKKIEGQSYAAADWVKGSKYTNDDKANEAMDKANANAEAIETNRSELTLTKNSLTALVERTTAVEDRMTTAESKIDQKADSITLSVLETKVDGISIGGRNLLTKAACKGSPYYAEDASWRSGYGVTLPTTSDNPTFQTSNLNGGRAFAIGETYTLSFTAKAEGTTNVYTDLYPDTIGGIFGNARREVTTTPRRIVITDVLTSSADLGNVHLRFWRMASEPKYAIQIWDIKLEKGNKSTDWSPAPEDIEGDVSALEQRVSTAEQKITADAIVSTVTSSTSYKTLSSTAETAKSTAETAKANAATAQSTADTAKTNAATAQSTANTAKTNASNAQSTADTAKSKADSNATDITGLKTRMTTAESKIDQKADSITLSVLETKVDGIAVGGTNLLPKSKYASSVTEITQNSRSGYGYAVSPTQSSYTIRSEQLALESDVEYTLSFTAWIDANGASVGQAISVDLYPDDLPQIDYPWTTDGITNKPKRFVWTFSSSSENMQSCRLRFFFDRAALGYYVYYNTYITDIKLEKGNKSTDWSPAPEDPAGSLSVSSDYSKVDINTERVRIVSKRMEVAVPSDDGEDDVLRVDADGVHAEVVEADQIVSESVVHTQGAASYTPANAGELAAILEELSGKHLMGYVTINCASITSGSYAIRNISGGGTIALTGGTMNQMTIEHCTTMIYMKGIAFSNSGTALTVSRSPNVYANSCVFNAGVGVNLNAEWFAQMLMNSCSGDCTVLANVGMGSQLRCIGASKPTGTVSLTYGGEVYNATSDPTFAAKESPSIPTTQTVTVSLSPTQTYTLRGTSNSDGNKLYQGRYSSSQSLRKGVMLFTLPSDLTSANNIDSATLTLRRIAGAGQGGGVTVQVRCYNVTGTLYASKTAYEGQTVSIDVTSAVKAMKTNGYTGLMLYNPDTTTVGSKSYTASYSRFAGKGESGAPVLKVSYRK